MPGRAVRVLDVQIDGDLADVVQQRGPGRARSPGFGLGRLRFRRGSGGQQVRLPQLERVGGRFPGRGLACHRDRRGEGFRTRELLDQLGIAFQRCEVQRCELLARQRGALRDVLQRLLSARRRQQRCG